MFLLPRISDNSIPSTSLLWKLTNESMGLPCYNDGIPTEQWNTSSSVLEKLTAGYMVLELSGIPFSTLQIYLLVSRAAAYVKFK